MCRDTGWRGGWRLIWKQGRRARIRDGRKELGGAGIAKAPLIGGKETRGAGEGAVLGSKRGRIEWTEDGDGFAGTTREGVKSIEKSLRGKDGWVERQDGRRYRMGWQTLARGRTREGTCNGSDMHGMAVVDTYSRREGSARVLWMGPQSANAVCPIVGGGSLLLHVALRCPCPVRKRWL